MYYRMKIEMKCNGEKCMNFFETQGRFVVDNDRRVSLLGFDRREMRSVGWKFLKHRPGVLRPTNYIEPPRELLLCPTHAASWEASRMKALAEKAARKEEKLARMDDVTEDEDGLDD